MQTPRRRRRDREPLNQAIGTPATVPTATGDIPNPVESFTREPTHDEIARRAYHLYEARGREHGRDMEDWFQAERELRGVARQTSGDSIVTMESRYAIA
jgi:hypothetical protein